MGLYLVEGKRGPDPAVSVLMERESWDQKVEDLSGIITGLHGAGRTGHRPLPARWAA